VRRDYHVLFACPHCLRSKWVLKRDLEMSPDQVLNTFWGFECPVHGRLREKPLDVARKKDFKKGTDD
jgi:hypothetical protein